MDDNTLLLTRPYLALVLGSSMTGGLQNSARAVANPSVRTHLAVAAEVTDAPQPSKSRQSITPSVLGIVSKASTDDSAAASKINTSKTKTKVSDNTTPKSATGLAVRCQTVSSGASPLPLTPSVSSLRDPSEMTISLSRMQPNQASDSVFSAVHYMSALTESLAETAPSMMREIKSVLPRALGAQVVGLSDDAIHSGLETLIKRFQETPIHIGFVCDKKYFNDQGQFWQCARYYNRPLWYQQNGYRHPQPRRFEPNSAAPEQYPIYGALNMGLTGHGGWGASCFVLKPSACHRVVLHSRDTGEPDGIGWFALTATRQRPLPIIADWIRMGMLSKLWPALTGEKRGEFSLSPNTNVEAAIYTDRGYLSVEDIALIVLSRREAEAKGIDLTALRSAGQVHGIPIVIHEGSKPSMAFQEIPAYQKIMAQYAADAANPRP